MSRPLIMTGLAREALIRLLDVAGPDSLFDVELPPSLGTMKQAKITAKLDVPSHELGRWLVELAEGDDPRRSPRTSSTPAAGPSGKRLVRRTRVDSDSDDSSAAVAEHDDDNDGLADFVEADSGSSSGDNNPFVDSHAAERSSSSAASKRRKESARGSSSVKGKGRAPPPVKAASRSRRGTTGSASRASYAAHEESSSADDAPEEQPEEVPSRRPRSVSDAAGQATKQPNAKVRATPKKKAPRKSGAVSRRAGDVTPPPQAQPSPLAQTSPKLAHGTWADIRRHDDDDDREPAVFGLIPFSPEPEDRRGTAMDDVDELEEVEQSAGVAEAAQAHGLGMDFQPEPSPVKQEDEEGDYKFPPVAASPNLRPPRAFKNEPMDPSILLSPDELLPPRRPSPQRGGRPRSRSPTSEPFETSSPPVGLAAALLPSNCLPAPSPASAPATSVESLLDRLAGASSFHSQPSNPSPPTASTSRLPSSLPPPPKAPRFRVISHAPAGQPSLGPASSITTPGPATLSPASQRVDLPRAVPDAEPTSQSQSVRTTAEPAAEPAAAVVPSKRHRRPKRERQAGASDDEDEDEDEAAVTAKLEEAEDHVPAEESAAQTKARLKLEKRARKAARHEKKRLKLEHNDVGLSAAGPSAPRTANSSPPPPSSLDNASSVRSMLPLWTAMKPDVAGKAIVDWLARVQTGGTRMALLKDLFVQALDVELSRARQIFWAVTRYSEESPGLLSEPPRQAFQRWLLQDIREADRSLYARRIPIYAALLGLNPPYSFKVYLDEHLARLTGASAPLPVDFNLFWSVISGRLGTLEERNLLAPVFEQLRMLSVSPRLTPEAHRALMDLLAKGSSARRPAVVAQNEAVSAAQDPRQRCLRQITLLDVPGKAADVQHLKRVVEALLDWVKTVPRAQGQTQAPELACVAALALDRQHPFFLKPKAQATFFHGVSSMVHRALLNEITTCDVATYAARVPAFAEQLGSSNSRTYLRAYIDAHLERLNFKPQPSLDDVKHLVDIVRPAGAVLDKENLLAGLFSTLMRLRTENKLADVGTRMIVNDLVYLRRSNWKILPT